MTIIDSTAGNILNPATIDIDGIEVADVAGVSPIYSDAVIIPKTAKSLVWEILWNGDLTGVFTIQVACKGPWQDIPDTYMYGVSHPVGASYAGSLSATDLSAEAIGSSIIELDVGVTKLRLKYTNASGTGKMRAFVRARVGG